MPINLAGPTWAITDGTAAVDTILTQEANRIGPDIHKRTVHQSPWLDLTKQTSFPEGMGYQLGTLIYERSLPTTDTAGNTLGVAWTNLAVGDAPNAKVTTSTRDQILTETSDSVLGPINGRSYVQFARQLKQYQLKRANIESPKINVEDLRFAAYRTEQLRAVMDALTESTRYSWEERYRDEYDRLCKSVVICKTAGTAPATAPNATTKEGVQSWSIDYGIGTDTPDANISNKVMNSLYFRLVRSGAGANAYGRENARPVFGLVLSSEASELLTTEGGMLDNYRYNSAKVSELIAPLGIERSHKGFYHLIDDLAPRFSDAGAGVLTRVYPYASSSGVISENEAYNTAAVEAAYVLHADVMESQIPEPINGGSGLVFDPVNYRGKFTWKNIPSVDLNPDGTTGFFRGVLASASKPLKTEFGYVILFKRNTLTPAA